MKYIVEKIEEDIVRLENQKTGKYKNINISKLPKELKEGDCLIYSKGTYIIDNEEKAKRQSIIEQKFLALKENND